MENRKEQEQLLQKVASYLGDNWRLDTRDRYSLELINPPYRIYCTFGGWRKSEKNRIFFSGARPQRVEYYQAPQKISVSDKRDPKAMAAEIEKRLWPLYKKAADESIERQKRHKEEEKEIENIGQMFLKTGIIYDKTNNNRQYTIYGGGVGLVSGEIYIYGDKKINLKLHNISIESAIKIAYLIKNDMEKNE